VPELPEVETVRRDVDAVLVGRRVDNVVLGRLRSVRRAADPEDFRSSLIGRRVMATGRHGKYLLVHLDSDAVLVVHLRMSGQLLHGPASIPLLAHTHVRLALDDGCELRFVDPRTFGEMFVTTSELPELASLGPDALDPALDGLSLRAAARGRRVALKAFLLDQTVLAGVGSIYADEVCFRAGLRPGRSVARITGPQFARVHGHVFDVLSEAIEARGSTLGDGQYVGLDGRPGTFAARHRVHARAGSPCVDCGTMIRRGVIAQRSAYWCPTCQK
jgi:formamidopyrimidine-DNA glycosylase